MLSLETPKQRAGLVLGAVGFVVWAIGLIVWLEKTYSPTWSRFVDFWLTAIGPGSSRYYAWAELLVGLGTAIVVAGIVLYFWTQTLGALLNWVREGKP